MRIIHPRQLPKNGILCPTCKVPADWDGFEWDNERYDLARKKHNAWFRCPICNLRFLVEDFKNADNKKKKGSD